MQVEINVDEGLIRQHGQKVDDGCDCPIYHGMTRAGIPVGHVSVDDFTLEGDDEPWVFDEPAQRWQLRMIGLLMEWESVQSDPELDINNLRQYESFGDAALAEVGVVSFEVRLPLAEPVPA